MQKQLLDLLAGLRRQFPIAYFELFCDLPSFTGLYNPIRQVNFIANQYSITIARPIIVEEPEPSLSTLQGSFIGNVIDYDGTYGILQVAGDERSKAFLAGGIPELEPVVLVAVGDVLGKEVDAYGGLS